MLGCNHNNWWLFPGQAQDVGVRDADSAPRSLGGLHPVEGVGQGWWLVVRDTGNWARAWLPAGAVHTLLCVTGLNTVSGIGNVLCRPRSGVDGTERTLESEATSTRT